MRGQWATRKRWRGTQRTRAKQTRKMHETAAGSVEKGLGFGVIFVASRLLLWCFALCCFVLFCVGFVLIFASDFLIYVVLRFLRTFLYYGSTIAGIRGSMGIRLLPCMTEYTPPLQFSGPRGEGFVPAIFVGTNSGGMMKRGGFIYRVFSLLSWSSLLCAPPRVESRDSNDAFCLCTRTSDKY